jgi:hypothetical protein
MELLCAMPKCRWRDAKALRHLATPQTQQDGDEGAVMHGVAEQKAKLASHARGGPVGVFARVVFDHSQQVHRVLREGNLSQMRGSAAQSCEA